MNKIRIGLDSFIFDIIIKLNRRGVDNSSNTLNLLNFEIKYLDSKNLLKNIKYLDNTYKSTKNKNNIILSKYSRTHTTFLTKILTNFINSSLKFTEISDSNLPELNFLENKTNKYIFDFFSKKNDLEPLNPAPYIYDMHYITEYKNINIDKSFEIEDYIINTDIYQKF